MQSPPRMCAGVEMAWWLHGTLRMCKFVSQVCRYLMAGQQKCRYNFYTRLCCAHSGNSRHTACPLIPGTWRETVCPHWHAEIQAVQAFLTCAFSIHILAKGIALGESPGKTSLEVPSAKSWVEELIGYRISAISDMIAGFKITCYMTQ